MNFCVWIQHSCTAVRALECQAENPGSNPVLLCWTLGKFKHFILCHCTQLYEWVPGHRQWWIFNANNCCQMNKWKIAWQFRKSHPTLKFILFLSFQPATNNWSSFLHQRDYNWECMTTCIITERLQLKVYDYMYHHRKTTTEGVWLHVSSQRDYNWRCMTTCIITERLQLKVYDYMYHHRETTTEGVWLHVSSQKDYNWRCMTTCIITERLQLKVYDYMYHHRETTTEGVWLHVSSQRDYNWECMTTLRRAQWLRGRASDSRLREPGFESWLRR